VREVSFTARVGSATEPEGCYERATLEQDVMRRVDERSFDAEVLERSRLRPVVVDFTAPWCAPCRAIAPLLEHGVRAREGVIDLVEVDVDDDPALARRFWIWGLPAVRAFHHGRIVARLTGGRDRPRIERFLDDVAARAR
jgi:putative thioredoxin